MKKAKDKEEAILLLIMTYLCFQSHFAICRIMLLLYNVVGLLAASLIMIQTTISCVSFGVENILCLLFISLMKNPTAAAAASC